MTGKVFFDTNVLVYAFDPSDPRKQTIARNLIRNYGSAGNLYLSTQVLQEFYMVTTRVKRQLLTKELASEVVSDLAEYPVVTLDSQLIKQAMQRHQGKAFSFWDSLVVEAALSSGCSTLYSEDMQDGLMINNVLQISNPFAETN
jgi:predicted nucleic acid-binding protein